MAVTCAVGLDGLTTTETEWARYNYALGHLASFEGFVSGGDVTPGGGTRELSVSAFESIVPGVLVSSDVAESVTVAANTSGANRLDYLVLAVDWSGTAATAGDVTMVTGGAALPTLTRTPGTLWQMPLARITVRNGVTTLLASDLEACKPLPRRTRLDKEVVAAGQSMGPTASAKTIGSLSFTDPGWLFQLKVTAQVRFQPSTGYGVLTAKVNGTTIQQPSYSLELDQGGGAHMTHLSALSSPRAGAANVILQMSPSLMTAGNTLEINSAPVSIFMVEQIPV